jgi:diaminohydroxyphosphoribosylaminopyrimidine deaminase / 5-amino-6-(5-phosphoribosylamino)uracil reductase
LNPHDTALLERAFAEAEKGEWLWTAPNPRVGALALQNGHVVGFGYHQRFAQAHAEEAALIDAGASDGERARRNCVDEIVVTLEPCSARGGVKKRRPCVEWILEAGIQRVVVGAVDPDPRHAGKGLEQLRAAGVEVVLGAGQARFEQQNPAFLAALQHPARPWVLLKWAATLDGRTAAQSGDSQWITGAPARLEVHQLRALGHAVMAGKGTVQHDNPRLTARDALGHYNPKVARVLVGAAATITPAAALLQDACPRIWIERPATTLPSWATQLDHVMEVDCDADGQFHLEMALQKLSSDFQIGRLLVEGGARLHGSLLAAGLADALVRYEAPLLLGGGRGAVEGQGVAHPRQGWHLHSEERQQLGVDLRRAFLIQNAS